jgi:hypothetical protein
MSRFTHDLIVELGFRSEDFNKGIKKSEGGLTSLNKKFDDLGGVAKAALATGVVGGAVAAGKAIYELGQRGADVIQTGESFEFLKEKLDLMPDLLERLRESSRGTVDDMTLMSGTATLLAGTSDELGKAMGNATPQLLKIAKAANKLNPSLGDTAFMYQSIATGVKRAQPLILDNLGLTLKVGDANAKMAKSLGKEEKAMAILNATLEAGDQLIDQVGGNVDSAADAYARLETSTTNLKDELAVLAADGLEPVITGLADLTTNANVGRANIVTWHEAITSGKVTRDEFLDWFGEYIRNEATASDLLAILDKKTEEYRKSLDLSFESMYKTTDGLRTIRDEYIKTDEAVDGLRGSQDGLNLAMKEYNDRLLFNVASAGLTAEAQWDLAEAMGLLDSINKDGIIDVTEATEGYIDAVGRLKDKIDAIPDDQVKSLQYKITETRRRHEIYTQKFVTEPAERRAELERDPRWGRQHGGPVSTGEAYLVGERGPEMFVPGTSGNIIPNDQLRGARSSQRAKVQYIRNNFNYMNNPAYAAFMAENMRREEIEEIDRMI